MNKIYFPIVAVLAIAVVTVRCEDTPSEQCEGQHFEELHERIQVIPCGKTRCKLRKGSNTTVIFKFNPKHEVKELTNDVYALIGGLPLPFVGVSGVSACDHVKRADTGESAPCPLLPNQEYVYTNSFPIELFYPQVPLRVHWSLKDGTRDVFCFEVPAVITPMKKN